MSYFTDPRRATTITTPVGAIFGPKVMIINEFAGSGGDAMPWLFRKAGIGPLVGKRTWGGLVGHLRLSATDRRRFRHRARAWPSTTRTARGTWRTTASTPDIEVEMDPAAVAPGTTRNWRRPWKWPSTSSPRTRRPSTPSRPTRTIKRNGPE